MIIIGIDPGLTGAIASIDIASEAVSFEAIPTVELGGSGLVRRRVDGAEFKRVLQRIAPRDRAFLIGCEAVRILPGKNNAAQTQGSLLRSLGAIEGVVEATLGMAPMLIEPQKWQSLFGLHGKGKEKRPPGSLPRAVMIARGLYPGAAGSIDTVGSHNRADALLIAHYMRRHFA